jgi:hypothetical protein
MRRKDEKVQDIRQQMESDTSQGNCAFGSGKVKIITCWPAAAGKKIM